MEREKLGSRLGFILISAGCAIGIGNVWKFPYLAGQNGGGAFVLIYLFFLIVLGLPVMTMEFAAGRGSQKSPVRIFRQLRPDKPVWHIHGYASMIANYILMMFYTSVAGWMLQYFVKEARGAFVGMSAEEVGGVFNEMLAAPVTSVLAMAVVVIVGFLVCSIGLQSGLERVTKVMMILLLVIMVILAGHSMFLKDGAEGLSFYLKPDLGRMKEAGIVNVITAAMNQAFFTLSLGIGSMAIFGSYIGKDHSLLGESVNVALLDTFVAITSGLIIFPACFAYGVSPDSGPGLIFITLPQIFVSIPFGRFFGFMFFVILLGAAATSSISLFEVAVTFLCDQMKMTRQKAVVGFSALCLIVGTFVSLSFGKLSGFKIGGKILFDQFDFLASNILLPLGGLLTCIAVGWFLDSGKLVVFQNKILQKSFEICIKWVAPVFIILILLKGLELI